MLNKTTVVVAVIEEKGSVFLMKRPQGAPLEGCWEFPGGKIEYGETYEEALVREVWEEVGWEIAVLEKMEEVDYNYLERDVRLHFYKCIRKTQKNPTTPLEYVWTPIRELPYYKIPPANQKVVEKLIGRDI